MVEMLDLVEDDDDELMNAVDTDWYKKIRAEAHNGWTLRTRRMNAGMTLAALAAKSGIAKSHLSAMENGKRALGLQTAKNLGVALGCDHRDLLRY